MINHPWNNIVNTAFATTGVYPEHCKSGIIIPLFKKGEKCNPANYRPVTLLPAPSKIIEKLFVSRLMSYLNKHNLLTPAQFAYQKNKSVQTAIYNFLTIIYECLERSECTIGVFYDLTRAFECIVLQVLIPKLKSLGIHGNIISFIESMLTNRKLYVQVKNTVDGVTTIHKSRTKVWSLGTAQGSISSAFLFLIGINDLPNFMQDQLIKMFADQSALLTLYADDINQIIHSKDLDTLTQMCINTINSRYHAAIY